MSKKPKAPAQHPLLNFRADDETYRIIDNARREEEDIPTRSEMLRRIVKRYPSLKKPERK